MGKWKRSYHYWFDLAPEKTEKQSMFLSLRQEATALMLATSVEIEDSTLKKRWKELLAISEGKDIRLDIMYATQLK